MNIFYYSVHHILEDDEIRLFKSLGHNVFCFGVNRRDGATQGFRPSIEFNDLEKYIYDDYAARGGNFDPQAELPSGFESHFSLFIVMHDISFLARHWHRLKEQQVIWRTIGQRIDESEAIAAPLREDGLRIVRYSPAERLAGRYCGEDAIIRFYKDPLVYTGWSGALEQPLLFSNQFERRYPEEAGIFREVSKTMPIALGGGGNDHMPGTFGFLGFEEQVEKYKIHSSYIYMTGLDIPYTLNFIEAWMTGIPLVIYTPTHRTGKFFEIDRLISDNVDGIICRSAEALTEACRELRGDRKRALAMSEAGRASAIRLFGRDAIVAQWAEMLATFGR